MTSQASAHRNTSESDDDSLRQALSASGAVAVRRTLLLAVVGTLVLVAVSVGTGHGERLAMNAINGIVLPLWCYVELRRGRINRALMLFSWLAWAASLITAVYAAGIRAPFLVIIPGLVMVTAWVQGRRPATLMAAASIAGLCLLAVGEGNGWWPPPVHRTPLQIALSYSLVLALMTVFGVLVAEHLGTLATRDRQRSIDLKRANREMLALLNSASEVAIIAMDLSGHVTLFNPGAQKLLGYDEREMIGQFVGKYVPVDDIKDRASDLGKALGRKVGERPEDIVAATVQLGGITRNATYVTKNGQRVRVSVVTSVVNDEGGYPVGMMSIAKNITAQIAAEASLQKLNLELETRVRVRTEDLQRALDDLRATKDKLVQAEKLASLGSLVAAIAHELNTPIGTCVSVSSTLHERVNTMKAQFDAGSVKKSGLEAFFGDAVTAFTLMDRNLERSARLISSFRQVATQAQSLTRRRVSLKTLMAELNSALDLQLRGLPFRVECEVIQDGEMDSYPEAITSVIAQLAENAVTHGFARRGEGTIRLSAESVGERVIWRVSDDGGGMDEETRRRALDPFFTTRLGQGTSGLGLYICYNLITGPLGGDIEVASAIGAGTRFTFTLPRLAPGTAAA